MSKLQPAKAQIAMIMSTTARSAHAGTDSFEGNGYSDLRSLCALWENNCQIIVDKSIQSIEDLAGKKFVVGANLSGTETDSRSILSAFGLYYAENDASKNNVEAIYLDYTQGVDALKNGQVSGVMNVSKAPASTVTDLLSTGNYHILSFTEDDIAKISAVNDLYSAYTIPFPGGCVPPGRWLRAGFQFNARLSYWRPTEIAPRQRPSAIT